MDETELLRKAADRTPELVVLAVLVLKFLAFLGWLVWKFLGALRTIAERQAQQAADCHAFQRDLQDRAEAAFGAVGAALARNTEALGRSDAVVALLEEVIRPGKGRRNGPAEAPK